MTYNPELVKALLGEQLAELFDGTVEIEKCDGEKTIGGLTVGDKLTFTLKVNPNFEPRQFIITSEK